MYKLAAIATALFAILEPSAAYDKPITLRRLHSRSTTRRRMGSSAPISSTSSSQTMAPVVATPYVSTPVYIPHRIKAGKRQLVHYQAPYEN